MDKEFINLYLDLELNARNNKKYKVERIKDSTICVKKIRGQLSDFYYLVF